MTNDEVKKLIEDAKKAIAFETESNDAQHIANTCPAKIVPLLEELLRLRYRIRSLEQ